MPRGARCLLGAAGSRGAIERGLRLNHGQLAAELAVDWAALVPQRCALRHLCEAEHFLHAAVAVGCDDEDRLWDVGLRVVDTHDSLVVERSLLSVAE